MDWTSPNNFVDGLRSRALPFRNQTQQWELNGDL